MHISCRKKVHKRKFFHWEGGQKEKRDRLSEDVVQSSSLEIFRTKPDMVLGTLLHFNRGVGGDVKRSRGPSFFILWFYEISLEGPQVCNDLIWVVGCGVPRTAQLRDLYFWMLRFDFNGELSTTQAHTQCSALCNGGQNWKGKSTRTFRWVEINSSKYNKTQKKNQYF